MTTRTPHLIGLFTANMALLLDQVSKWYLLEIVRISERPPIEVTHFFNLVMVWNRGISFGMFSGHDRVYWLSAMSLLIVLLLLYWMARAESRLIGFALGCVIGGAIGNVIDRLRLGAVADFFDFHVAGYSWPAFNIADSTIFIGVVLLCIHGMVWEKHPHAQGKRP